MKTLLFVLGLTLAVGDAQAAKKEPGADKSMEFVHRVMRTEMDYSRQFMDPDKPPGASAKDRWPDVKSADAERMKYISRKYLLDYDVDPTMRINGYKIDDYEVLGRSGPLVFVRRYEESCMKKQGCSNDTVLALNVVFENGRYLLVPGTHKAAMLPYWWAESEDRFDLPDAHFCTVADAPPEARMRATVESFMSMMTESNEKQFTRKQRLDFIARAFFLEHSLEPALVKLNNEDFTRYAIVGVYGPFVDVQLIRAKCPSCDAQFFRLKTVIEDGAVRIMPAGTSYWSHGKLNYWWTRTYYHAIPLCNARGMPLSNK